MTGLATSNHNRLLAGALLMLTASDVVVTVVFAGADPFAVLALPVYLAGLHSLRSGRRPGLVAFLCLTPAFGFSLLGTWDVGVFYAMVSIALFVVTLGVALAQTRERKRLVVALTFLVSPLWVAFSVVTSFVLLILYGGLS